MKGNARKPVNTTSNLPKREKTQAIALQQPEQSHATFSLRLGLANFSDSSSSPSAILEFLAPTRTRLRNYYWSNTNKMLQRCLRLETGGKPVRFKKAQDKLQNLLTLREDKLKNLSPKVQKH